MVSEAFYTSSSPKKRSDVKQIKACWEVQLSHITGSAPQICMGSMGFNLYSSWPHTYGIKAHTHPCNPSTRGHRDTQNQKGKT